MLDATPASRAPRVLGVVLAGGRATRLGGVDKPLLRVGGETILARAITALAEVADEVVIVGDPGRHGGHGRTIADRRAGLGPLAGLEAALADAAGRADQLLVVGGDMPALSPAALRLVRDARPEADVAAPLVDGRYEPLHARYAARLAAEVSERLDRGALALADLLAAVDVATVGEAELRAVDPSLATLANVNTPDDLARLVARLPR